MTAPNIFKIREMAQHVWAKRTGDIGIVEPEPWSEGFEAGFMRALGVLGVGSAELTAIQISDIALTYFVHSGEPYSKDVDSRPHDWVINAMTAVAKIYETRDTNDALFAVVEHAIERGEVPTISLRPLEPLRMGNYQFEIHVRPRTAQTPANVFREPEVVDETQP